MFTKQPSSLHQDDQPTATIDRIHPVGLETMPPFDAPTIENGSGNASVTGSVIGSDLTILGENINIVSSDSLQIDGEVHGDVSGKNVNIGAGGMVIGTICAESVEIDGGVRGTVRAKEVRLNKDAKVSGDLVHLTLIVSQGAEFEGSVHRPDDVAELKPNLEAANPDKGSKPTTPELSPKFYGEPAEIKPLEKPALGIKAS